MCPTEIRPLLVEYHPFTQFADYPAGLAALNLDIAVAPLAQLPFNQGKSNLRLLEYGIVKEFTILKDVSLKEPPCVNGCNRIFSLKITWKNGFQPISVLTDCMTKKILKYFQPLSLRNLSAK